MYIWGSIGGIWMWALMKKGLRNVYVNVIIEHMYKGANIE